MTTSSPFGLSRYQLQELMSQKGKDGLKRLSEYDGVLGIADHLRSNVKGGLDGASQDLELRKLEYGANYIEPVPPKSFLALALDAIQDKTLVILIVAALVSIVLGVTVEEQKDIAWIEGAAILAAVVLVVVVTAINDWTKERQFRGLQKKLDTDSRFFVLRDGKTEELPLAEIVVGDVAEFKYGNTFPVDGILIKGFDVKVDESSLTGEAALVKKHADRDSMLYAGTQVMEGGGTMLVTAVGASSQQGMIFKLMMAQSEDDAGFITLALRRLYRKVMQRFRHSRDTEQGGRGEKGVEVQEIPIDPREGNRLTEGSDDSIESEEEEPSLTGCDQCNLLKRVQRKKKRQQQKKKKSEGESSGSGSVLQKKLNKLALQIGYAGTAAALLCVLVLTIRFAIEQFGINGRAWNSSTDFSELLHFVIIGVTVLVVAVPEGLPLAVTIALAFSVKKMLKDNNLVRHLHACETMGNATAICSDKTGTLTTNRMTVVESYFAGTKYDVTPRVADLPEKLLDILSTNVAVNSSYTSKLITEDEENESGAPKGLMERMMSWRPWKGGKEKGLLGRGLAKQVGNVTECALLGFLVELGIDYEAIREEHPTEIFTKVFTFNSARKSMTTVIPLPGGGHRMLTKGASEIVLRKCTSILGENGRVIPLSSDDNGNVVNTVVQPMAEAALRTICLAYRDFPVSAGEGEIASSPDWDDEEGVVTDLTCIGIVGIEDPVRPEVPGCIKQCQEAGITVRMVTGDNIDTARSIAVKCGITAKGDKFLVLEGKELNKRIRDDDGQVNEEKLDKVWPWLRVLARSSPQDKYTLVEGIIQSHLRKNREVVAVTGDGTNDGPALKRADVGFAMGIAGTDVAKEASDIILTDDNFASIVKAVMWGRNVYDSISKFLQFQLTVNVVAVSLALISAIIITDSPLRAVQMLWVNLIMDTFASLALATEPPSEELLKRKPYGRNKALLSRQMWLFIAGHSIYQLSVMLVLVFAGELLFDIDDGKYRALRATPTQHFTLVFNTFVFMQIFNEINARKVHGERNVFKGIHRNWIFLVVVAGQVAVQVVLVQAGGPFGLVFSTTRIPLDQWLWCLFLGSTELVVGQILLLIPVHKIPKLRRKGGTEVDFEQVPELEDPMDPRTSAKLLWVKSLTRIRTQIRVVNAFRSGLESGAVIHLSHLPQFTSTPRASRYNPTPTLSGKETAV